MSLRHYKVYNQIFDVMPVPKIRFVDCDVKNLIMMQKACGLLLGHVDRVCVTHHWLISDLLAVLKIEKKKFAYACITLHSTVRLFTGK